MNMSLKKQLADIIIHINEDLNNEQRSQLSTDISHLTGIKSASIQEKHPHLMIIGYDTIQTTSLAVLADVRNTGVRAQIVGWL